ncbi:hypothetical protein Tcan_15756 [Toxocara canis]|uniref:Uncharacterized protein n=1 Tax=Toxocara canis TaxID=6265 RepID=A0A0B2VKX6_TOXCA|nr:hypothetical protein Tcan_15756 [Toxocara canis]
MVSTLEYLLTCCSGDHTCRSPLLFQQKISYNQEWYSITRLATALFCTKLDSYTLSSFVNLSEELWGSTERHYLIDQWARSIMSGSGEVEDEDGYTPPSNHLNDIEPYLNSYNDRDKALLEYAILI